MLKSTDQLVLDSVCDRVARRIALGVVGCPVGNQDEIAADAAVALKASVADVQAAISRLVGGKYLQHAGDELTLRHQAWLEWSGFNPTTVAARWGVESVKEWLAWDGIAEIATADN